MLSSALVLANLILLNGRIWTGGQSNSFVQAIAIEGNRITAVGTNDEVLSKAPGLELVDVPQSNQYPMPLNVAGKDNCQVGRLRLDCALENGLSFWVSGDQLLKGAALNAVQIAELL